MNFTTVIGILASVFTGVSLLPQLIKVVKEKKTEGLSFLMLAALFIGLGGWLWYGILKEDWIIILSNGFSLLVNATIALLGLVYKNERC